MLSTTALALNPYEIISGVLRDVVGWILDAAGIEGVATGAVILALIWLWWGYKLSTFTSAGRTIAGTIAQHAIVSGAVASAVLLALLYTGVIPGVDMQAAGALVSGALDMVPLLFSPWEFLRNCIAAPAEVLERGMFVTGESIAGGPW